MRNRNHEIQEEVVCDCCGFTEECMAPYITSVRVRCGTRRGGSVGSTGMSSGRSWARPLHRSRPRRRSTTTPALWHLALLHHAVVSGRE
ncbi:hypothetical protein E2562_009796 [Oryza meyeriana var. granulata]|uniref:Uncharacterized protein n=1 Tax=Oryza meyeriana var. granulata TaxID=110450 RepID=A0A6G1EA44_9ORYZ|nr:hypothetical protein E2562_009796 [Oryza meyeriana var. granulata]